MDLDTGTSSGRGKNKYKKDSYVYEALNEKIMFMKTLF
jgi:hypothetical protein